MKLLKPSTSLTTQIGLILGLSPYPSSPLLYDVIYECSLCVVQLLPDSLASFCFQVHGLFHRDQVNSFHSLRPWLHPLLHLCCSLWQTQTSSGTSRSQQNRFISVWSFTDVYGRLKHVQEHPEANKTYLLVCGLSMAI